MVLPIDFFGRVPVGARARPTQAKRLQRAVEGSGPLQQRSGSLQAGPGGKGADSRAAALVLVAAVSVTRTVRGCGCSHSPCLGLVVRLAAAGPCVRLPLVRVLFSVARLSSLETMSRFNS